MTAERTAHRTEERGEPSSEPTGNGRRSETAWKTEGLDPDHE